MHRSKRNWRRKIPFMVLFVLGFAAILSFVVMWLWNQVLVPVTGVKVVNFWQAAGLLILCRILFGGFKGGPWKGRHAINGGRSGWKEKWKNMSDEEREQLKERWKERCK